MSHTQDLGFSLNEVCRMLALIDGGDYTCDDMRSLARAHLADVRARRADLQRMEIALAGLVGRCTGGATPDCSMLESLFEEPEESGASASEASQRWTNGS